MRKGLIILLLFLNFSACSQNGGKDCNSLTLGKKNAELIHLINEGIILGIVYKNTTTPYFSIEGKTENSVHIQKVLNISSVGNSYLILFESELMGASGIKQGAVIYNKVSHDLTYTMIGTEIIKADLCKGNKNLDLLQVEYKLKHSFMDEITERKKYKIKEDALIEM